MKVYRFTISEPPPSVNGFHSVVNGRKITSKKGRDWKELADLELRQFPAMKEDSYWKCSIQIPGTLKGDIDNYQKPILDALVASERTPDDRYLVDTRIRFHGGDHVAIALKREETQPWATFKRASKSLTRRLARFTG